MYRKFIEKFKTEHFSIGSFDYYRKEAEKLIRNNTKMKVEETKEYVDKKLPGSYRAAIVDNNGNFVGYIALYNVKGERGLASIRMETNRELTDAEKEEITGVYKNWMFTALDLNDVEEELCFTPNKSKCITNNSIPKANIILPCKMLEAGVSEETKAYFAQFHELPKILVKPYTIKHGDRVIGIIGLTTFQWQNKRANLQLFLDEALGDEIINELSGHIINEYLDYIHSSNVHNVTLTVPGSNVEMLEVVKNSNMNYYSTIPYGAYRNGFVESGIQFQHVPGMVKQNGIYIPDNTAKPINFFDTEKKLMDPVVKYYNDYRLVSPKVFRSNRISINKVVDGQARALQDADNYAISLGDYKYIIQKGNRRFGVTSAVRGYDYVLLNSQKEFIGYINILRNNAHNKNAEIELAIIPEAQGQGLGSMILKTFCEQLFSIGYASVTSSIFEFNIGSETIHKNNGFDLSGTRIESYYVNNRPWNMNIYTKVNSVALETETQEKNQKNR